MGVFNRLFSSSTSSDSAQDNKKSELDWTPLISLEQLSEIKAISTGKKVLIFKHSTRCGISSTVLRQFEKAYKVEEDQVLYFLDLLQHRDISNALALEFSVTHQSPQLLVIENGICTQHASHHQILE